VKNVKFEDIQCPIKIPRSERTYSRRCEFHTGNDGFCPVHQNVVAYIKKYRKTRILTDEAEILTDRREASDSKLYNRFINFIFDRILK